MKYLTILPLILCGFLVGCAAPQQKTVSITTTPAGAAIFIDGQEKGVAPYQSLLDFTNKKSYEVVAKLPEHDDASRTISFDPSAQTEYPLALAKKERVVIKVVQIEPTPTEKGLELKPVEKEAVAYLETIERSSFVPSVTQMTQNTDPTELVGEPVLSPLGDFFVFATSVTRGSAENTSSNIWKQYVSGSKSKTQLTTGLWRDIHPALSPEGQYIYFSSNRSGLRNTLWRMLTVGTGGITKITNSDSADYAPALGEKSDVLVFSSLPPSANAPQIWTVQKDGSLPTQIREGESPQLSPDGKKILFVRMSGTVNKYRNKRLRQLWVLNFDGSAETILTEAVNGDIKDARWSPDGQWVMYACDEGQDSTRANNYDIYLMSADGSPPMQLTTNGSWDDGPCMDPAQEYIYFRSNRGGHFNIWRFPAPAVVKRISPSMRPSASATPSVTPFAPAVKQAPELPPAPPPVTPTTPSVIDPKAPPQ